VAEQRDAEWWKTHGAKHGEKQEPLRIAKPPRQVVRGLPSHKAQPSESLLVQVVKNHILASGPIGFAEIQRYVREQVPGEVEDYQIVGVMNQLAREGIIELYDDGTTWNIAVRRIR
jgi:hypothetical protein